MFVSKHLVLIGHPIDSNSILVGSPSVMGLMAFALDPCCILKCLLKKSERKEECMVGHWRVFGSRLALTGSCKWRNGAADAD